jgi:AcrR family transcriptional regulator
MKYLEMVRFRNSSEPVRIVTRIMRHGLGKVWQISMADNRTDRRVRRTKALLQQGLIQLMETKDVKDISVKELSDLADINRGTFYLHYSDIYDMLKQLEDELFAEFYDIIDRTLPSDSAAHCPQTTLFEVFSFLERHREIARVMISPHGDLAFVNRLKNLVQKRLDSILASKLASGDGCYLEAFAVSGCIGVIETWLAQPMPPTPDIMAVICGNMLENGFMPN